jgi:hypothetical protein
VTVIVVVSVNSESFGVSFTEQFQIGGIITDGFGVTMATHMLVQANDFICG